MIKLQEKKPQKFQLGGKNTFYPKSNYEEWLQQELYNEKLQQKKSKKHDEEAQEIVLIPKSGGFDYVWKDIPTTTGDETDNNKYDSGLAHTFKSSNNKSNNKSDYKLNPLGLVKPIINASSLLMNLNNLKRTRDAAKNIKAPTVNAAIIPNRPVTGLDPEIISLYQKRVGDLNVKKTSDPISNRIAEQMLTLKKISALEGLTAKQVEHLFKETMRHDKTAAINAQEAVKARNIENKYFTDVHNKRAAIDAGYESRRQDIINRWIEEGLVKPIEKRVSYNLGRKTIKDSEDWNRLQTKIINTQNLIELEPDNRAAVNHYKKLINKQNELSDVSLPNYDETMNYLFK